ncbi:MAG TPA: hypothetical protein DC023_06805 [Oceanospirillaceae bacterium]|nr:hypothetical protein [Oceanospirillaceae bacterium]
MILYSSHSLPVLYRHATLALLICLPIKASATDLTILLAEQEQQLLHIAEQKRQLQNLSDLLPSLQALTNYPQASIELLLDTMPMGRLSADDKELLKQVINTLRPQSMTDPIPAIVTPTPATELEQKPESETETEPVQKLNNILPALQQLATYPKRAVEILIDDSQLGGVSSSERQQLKQVIDALRSQPMITENQNRLATTVNTSGASLAKTPPDETSKQTIAIKADVSTETELETKPETLHESQTNIENPIPVMAILGDEMDKFKSRVVFQTTESDTLIILQLGQTFEYENHVYQLLDIQFDTSEAVTRFDIQLQTPEGIKTYQLPRSVSW